MRSTTRAIVLHTTPYSETSLIVKAFAEQSGAVSLIVSGVKGGRGRMHSNLFQPLSLLELTLSGRHGATMQRITDASFSPPFTTMHNDVVKSTIALFLAEVMYRSIREEAPNPTLFGFIHRAVQILDLIAPGSPGLARFHLHFMIQMTRHLGFFPHGEYKSGQSLFDMQEGTFTTAVPRHPEWMEVAQSQILYRMMTGSFDDLQPLSIPKALAKSLLHSLARYFELHVTQGHPIVSYKVLEEVLS